MKRWKLQRRVYTVNAFYQNSTSYEHVRVPFRNHFQMNRNGSALPAFVIKNWINNFEEETSSTTMKKPEKPRTVRYPENIERIRVAIEKKPASLSLPAWYHTWDFQQNV